MHGGVHRAERGPAVVTVAAGPPGRLPGLAEEPGGGAPVAGLAGRDGPAQQQRPVDRQRFGGLAPGQVGL
ncbi:MAG: hypothetical protein ACRDOI_35045 [Trebonia sp.]